MNVDFSIETRCLVTPNVPVEINYLQNEEVYYMIMSLVRDQL